MDYEKRLVFFIDILGFKDKINSTIGRTPKSQNLVDDLYRQLESMPSILEPDESEPSSNLRSRRVTHFSDSIAVSFKVGHPEDLFWVLRRIQYMLYSILITELVCRGGSAYGDIIHTDRVLFGPALVEAYESQSKAAVYPRIIIKEDVIQTLKADIDPLNSNISNHAWEQISEYISLDYDGMYYVDYFGKFIYDPDFVKLLRKIIESGLKRNEPDLQIKYGWMRQKFNAFIDNLNFKGHDYPRINSGALA